jgi:N,N-dimethylformamidase
VGLEIDRYDHALGSPEGAHVLASSEPLTDNATYVQEELLVVHPGTGGTQHPDVRADMVFFKTDGGGAVFSASSIAWGSALPWNNYDNDVSRLMANIIDAFSAEEPLP